MSEKSKTSLDSKSIKKIAAEVGQNMRQARAEAGGNVVKASERDNGSEKSRTGKSGFFWGAVAGVGFAVAAPMFSKQLRPVVRGAIKGGIVTGRYVRKVAEGVKEDLQDMSAEAKAELDSDSIKA